jgi:hypothetical protein
MPTPTLANAHDLLRSSLLKMPSGALNPWKAHLGISESTGTSDTVDAVMGSLINRPKLQDVIDGLVQGFTGWIDNGFGADDAEDAATTLANAVSTLSGIVQSLQQAESSGTFSGNAVMVDFSTMADASSWGSAWSQSYYGTGSGTLGITSGKGAWQGSADSRWGNARYSTMGTKTDYQKIGAVFSSKPSRTIFNGKKSTNRIMGRASSDLASYVAVDFQADSFNLNCSNSWSYTWLANGPSGFKFNPGAIYWLECGTSGGVRIYRVWENSTILKTYVDSAALTQVGSSYRHTGVSAMAFNDTYVPAQVASYAFFDNAPPAVRGCGWRVSRTSSSGTTLTNGDQMFDSSYFDTPVYLTDGLTHDASSNKITVSVPGWYLVTVNQGGGSAISIGSGRQAATLHLNGAKVQQAADNFSQPTSDFAGFNGTFIVYCAAGDYLQPGYNTTWPSGSNSLLKGESSGTQTFWSGTFLGNKQPS